MTHPAGHPIPARRRWHLLCLAAVCTLPLLLLLAAAANATLGGANDGLASTSPLAPANAAQDQPPVPAPAGPRLPAAAELPSGPQPGPEALLDPTALPDAPALRNAPHADVWYLQDAKVSVPEPAAAVEALPARTGMGDDLIMIYSAGEGLRAGDFDVADIPLVSPVAGASVTLPADFCWTPRGAPGDNYALAFYYPATGETAITSYLGGASCVNVTGLPTGWPSGATYTWYLMVYQGNNPDATPYNYGASYYARQVTIGLTPR